MFKHLDRPKLHLVTNLLKVLIGFNLIFSL